ncbi:MAG TPA: alcohol dehydrogenase catalytic domain-containing protein [Anaerolineae bacterium]|nr:alcohol dehydrogenase catalytic domain-containing protein [Anaerolineae bacterium]HQJ51672.1 alcohol dehydrogenase catalytic domain-containing protein [Anaerolineae bacterium]
MAIPDTMTAAVLYGPNDLRLREVPVPRPGPEEVLLKVQACAICGTDPKVISADWPYPLRYGEFTPGHEYAGEIVAVGDTVGHWQVGDRVAVEAHKGCGKCVNCMRGQYTSCLNYGKMETGHRHYGFTTNGGYAQYVVNHINTLYPVPESLPFWGAALATTAGCAMFAIENVGGFMAGETVAVLGPGPMGLMALQIVKALGASKVFLTGTRPERLAVGKRYGADVIIDVTREDPVAIVRRETGGLGANLVIEVTGDPLAAAQSIEMAAKGGRISFIGDPLKPALINIKKFVLDDMRAAGVRGEGRANCARAMELFRIGKLSAEGIVTHRFPLREIHKALDTYIHRRDGAIKVVLEPQA